MLRAVATYRVQLCPQFSFHDAASVADYLAALGVSHLYASPYLQAAAGSTHGYDVVDPGEVNRDLGGPVARDELARTLAGVGVKQLIDRARWWVKHGRDFTGTCLHLPPGQWRDVLNDRAGLNGEVCVQDILNPLPVAALERVR